MDSMAENLSSDDERALKTGRTNNGKGMGGKTDSQPSLGYLMSAMTKSGDRLEKRIRQMEDNMNNRMTSLEAKTAE